MLPEEMATRAAGRVTCVKIPDTLPVLPMCRSSRAWDRVRRDLDRPLVGGTLDRRPDSASGDDGDGFNAPCRPRRL